MYVLNSPLRAGVGKMNGGGNVGIAVGPSGGAGVESIGAGEGVGGLPLPSIVP